MTVDGPLAGITVVVTRPADQAAELVDGLERAGAAALRVPALTVVPPADGGAALRVALELTPFEWVVVTSANGARALAAAVEATGVTPPPVAAVGPRTADELARAGIEVALVPDTYVAEALVEVFPPGRGAVLVVRPEVARTVVADGLRAKGLGVTEVIAYRTAPATIEPALAAQARDAEVVTFMSPLTARSYVDQVGPPVDQVVVSIGPVTSKAIVELGVREVVEAEPQTSEGMVQALVEHWRTR